MDGVQHLVCGRFAGDIQFGPQAYRSSRMKRIKESPWFQDSPGQLHRERKNTSSWDSVGHCQRQRGCNGLPTVLARYRIVTAETPYLASRRGNTPNPNNPPRDYWAAARDFGPFPGARSFTHLSRN